MKNLPTIRNDSSFAVQFSNSVSETMAIFWFTMTIIEMFELYKHAIDVIRWISTDNPTKISHNYT